MIFNKVYVPVDCIEKHQEFQAWYEDGNVFMTAESDYESENSRLIINARTGAQMAKIKPDNKALSYDVGVERYTYQLKTYLIFKHYHCEGMLWQVYGTPSKGHCSFVNENTAKKDVLITTQQNFRGHGPCYEVKVKDIAKLRPAVCFLLAILWKEHWKGLSLGEIPEKLTIAQRLKNIFGDKGLTYEQVQAGETTVY
ncbi:MAG: hypothetical protein Q4E12_00300 [Coriobacteriia bacterium]|nr:hypothetical protein [Coriobacteriia bacterium]